MSPIKFSLPSLIYIKFCYFLSFTQSLVLKHDSQQTQHIEWNIVCNASQLYKNGPLVLTEDPSPKISFSPQSLLRLYIILEYFLSMPKDSLSASIDPLFETNLELRLTLWMPDNWLNSLVKTVHDELYELLLSYVGLPIWLNHFVSAWVISKVHSIAFLGSS